MTRMLGMCALAAGLSATALGGAAGRGAPARESARENAQKQARKRVATRKQASPRKPAAATPELEILARRLRDPSRAVAARAYVRLVALSRHWPRARRDRAALALGYYAYQRERYAQARAWFREARGDRLLTGYAIYWDGLAAADAGQDADAMALLGQFRQKFPGSVVDKPALEAYADAAIDGQEPDRALAALLAYPGVEQYSDLLVRLALARQKTGDLQAAALDFQRVYDLFPLNGAAGTARKGIDRLRAALGDQFPEAPIADRVARAETLFENGRWTDAKDTWEALLDSQSGVEGQRAALRVAECDSRLTGKAGALETLTLTDPALDAERQLALFDVYRASDNEDGMQATVDKVLHLSSAAAPDEAGELAELANRSLYRMGNYYWANLKRDQAAAYYRRFTARETTGPDAATADWRIAWTAYLEKSADATLLLRSHIEKFPDSPYIPDALYWLGRLAENAKDVSLARTYYDTASSRFAETYFGRLAGRRGARLETKNDPPVSLPLLSRIPALAPFHAPGDSIPPDVRAQYERAMALRSIAFDESAMLELRNAYQVSHAPQLLIEAAKAAQQAKHYLTGAELIRQLVPDLESRPMDSVPAWVWRIVYPLPMRPLIDYYADHYHFDPMLYASLIRQESGFQPDALSSAGAVGLAQLEPYTARKWSRILHLWYSYRRLSDPRYNLRVSGAYFQSLITMFGSVQEAVAAYNAGESRVATWQADHHYDDAAEFVESIPFSQTRHYAEVVLNGAAIYRRLYEDRR